MLANSETSPPRKERLNNDLPQQAEMQPQNPFANCNVKLYSQRPTLVPIFALDKISEAHYRDLRNTNVNNNQADISPLVRTQSKKDDDLQYQSFANDTFIKAINHNWHDFLATVKDPLGYTHGELEKTELAPTTDYFKPWGGDERLRLALVGNSGTDTLSDVEKVPGFWSKMFSLLSRLPEDLPRHRSKAGYWMLDEKRKDLVPTLRRILVQSPFFPLLLRIMILMFSSCALALAVSIYIYLRRDYDDSSITQQPSTIFAIVVQCLAIVYVIYIAYDEYSGKPLGLRNPLGKMKLIMLDLLFIIGMLANLSLTFYSLYDDEWVCQSNNTPTLQALGIYYPTVSFLCRRQRALASFLFLVLCLWVLVFTVSIVRVVDRVSVNPRND